MDMNVRVLVSTTGRRKGSVTYQGGQTVTRAGCKLVKSKAFLSSSELEASLVHFRFDLDIRHKPFQLTFTPF